MSIDIDCERLAKSLEDGIDPSGLSFYRGVLLSFPQCGIISTAVKLYSQDMGFSAETVISKSMSPFGWVIEHVMGLVNDKLDNPLIIDPTWGQFLYHIGYDMAYDKLSGRQIFPPYPEQILTFRLNDSFKAVKEIAKTALRFKNIEADLVRELVPADIDGDRFTLGKDLLPDVTNEEQMTSAFYPIWDPKNFQPFEPDSETVRQARQISNSMPAGIIRSYTE